jgi:peptide/nickel transport system ATP-binding protein
VMRGGRVVEEGEVCQIFANPAHPYTKALLAAVPQLGSMTGKVAPEPFPLLAEMACLEGGETARDEHTPLLRNYAPDRQGRGLVLEIDRLTVRFPVHKGLLRRVVANVHAVEDVSFKLAASETLAIVGESGSGKSTTGRAIMKLVETTSGDIIVNGRNVTDYSQTLMRPIRRNIQMVFQDPFASLDPRMTIGAIVAEPMEIQGELTHREIADRVPSLLEKVGLTASALSRYPFEFSGGQRQRICIARALALNPAIIIADEPVSALDVSIRAQVINLMMQLQDELGISYLFISHDMAVVERVSHRIAVMYLGRIVEIGPRAAVIENPVHPYTRRLLASVPIANPMRRVERTPSLIEAKSAVHPIGYQAEALEWREVGTGHFVLGA